MEVNFQARAQLLILHPFKLLEQPVDWILEGLVPLDFWFYRRGGSRFNVAGHPHAQASREPKQRDSSAHLKPPAAGSTWRTRTWDEEAPENEAKETQGVALELSLFLNHKSHITTICSASSTGLGPTESTSPFQTVFFRCNPDGCKAHVGSLQHKKKEKMLGTWQKKSSPERGCTTLTFMGDVQTFAL